jgi:hypothetical protein
MDMEDDVQPEGTKEISMTPHSPETPVTPAAPVTPVATAPVTPAPLVPAPPIVTPKAPVVTIPKLAKLKHPDPHAANPGGMDNGKLATAGREAQVADMEKNLNSIEHEKGSASPEADAMRSAMNNARYVK